MTYPLVQELAAAGFPVRLTCGVLGFSTQAFYKWRARPCSDRDYDDAHLTNALVDLHRGDPEFGYRFLADELRSSGHEVGERRVWRLCRQQRLWSTTVKKGRHGKRPGPAVHDDLVQRQFRADRPDAIWLTDITEHPTAEGKLYCCAIKDVFSNRIVGYAIGDRMTRHLAISALRTAVARRKPTSTVVVHSDRGGQFRSKDFRAGPGAGDRSAASPREASGCIMYASSRRFRAHLGRDEFASIVLVVGLLALCLLSISVAVTNNRAAEAARRSDLVAHLSEDAFDALLAEEDAADDVVANDDRASTRAYIAANEDTAAAIRALPSSAVEGSAYTSDDLLDLHRSYTDAVATLIAGFAGGPLGPAEAFEEAEVDPLFDPLGEALNEERKVSDAVAHEALASIERAQQRLLALTPVVAVISLALIVVFVVKLGRSRREVTLQSEESDYKALHDDLTGLPNRSLLRRSSALAVAQAENAGTQMALMVLDLDRFKEINDTLGHHAGDAVLEAVSQRLRGAVRSMDTVARLGGDEFAILLPHVSSPAAAVDVAAKVQRALVSSVDVGGIALDIDVSIGIALSGAHGRDVTTLLKHADIGMYRAKELDLGICVYDADHDDNSRVRLGLLGELRRAIDQRELTLDFQPKVALASGDFCGAEALVRWLHPTQGLLLPGDFLPAAERTALIRPLTQFVIDAALAECRRWRDEGTDLRLAVNISARNLLDAKFPDQVAALLTKWDLPATCLVFEVTESAIIVDPERAEVMLSRFAELGIELAIDDFGAGYTSLAHLRTLPVRELKIDQSLIAQMSISAKDALIVRALVDLGHNLGLRTVAEGIEDAETLHRLSVMGCDVGQGYHIGRPMDGAKLWQWRQDRVIAHNPAR